MNQLEVKPCIYFENVPLPYSVLCKSDTPYRIIIRSPDVKEHYVWLYPYNSQSYPKQKSHIFSNLIPQWNFYDLSGNIIVDKIKTTDTILYNNLNEIIGVEGYADFYYVDSMPSPNFGKCPLYIIATLETSSIYVDFDKIDVDVSGYSNSKLRAACAQYIYEIAPEFIGISFDGNLDHKINHIKWVNKNLYCTFTVCGTATDGSNVTLFSYPSSNILGSQNVLYRTINNLSGNQNWTLMPESKNYFQHTDSKDFLMGGFSRQYAIPQETLSSTYIYASSVVQYARPYDIIDFYEDRNKIFLGNPVNHTIDCFLFKSIPSSCDSLDFDSLDFSTANIDYTVISFPTPSCRTEDQTDYCFSDAYGIAVQCEKYMWYADAEFDLLVKRDYYLGQDEAIIHLPSNSTPTSVTMDSASSVWVTLFDIDIISKYDSTGSFLLSTDITSILGNYISPYAICADKNDDIYVSTMGIISNLSGTGLENFEENKAGLLKFNSNGIFLASYSIPASCQPQDIVIDNEDNGVWIVNSFDNVLPPYTRPTHINLGCVQKWISSTTIPSINYNIPRPEFITQDVYNGIWGTFGFGNLFYKPSGTTTFNKFIISGDMIWIDDLDHNYDNVILGQPVPGYNAEFNETLEGIAGDRYGNIWVINTLRNKLYSFECCDPLNTFKSYKLKGKGYAQSLGDWTGLQWERKYGYHINPRPFDTIVKTITGISNNFKIADFSDLYSVRKFNESWNPSAQLYSFCYPNFFKEFEVLWTKFLGNMFGGTEDYCFMRTLYERTANFVDNNNNIETCGIQQFYSLADMIDAEDIDDYKLDYPYDIKRIVDTYSINRQKLWGDNCKCTKWIQDYSKKCPNCNHVHLSGKNIGNTINMGTYELSLNTPIILKDIRKNGVDAYTLYNFVSYYYDNITDQLSRN